LWAFDTDQGSGICRHWGSNVVAEHAQEADESSISTWWCCGCKSPSVSKLIWHARHVDPSSKSRRRWGKRQIKIRSGVGVIAGYDIHPNQSAITNKLLVLLDDDTDGNMNEMAEENLESMTKLSGSAFWSTIVEESDGTTFLTNICTTSPSNSTDNNTTSSSCFCSTYIISLHEFHQGSEAFNVCSSIVSYLKSHPKIGPFLQPVDTVALHLFDYFTGITNPMDVST